MRTRHRQVELTLENQAAELAEQLRVSNTLPQEGSAQMLDQGNALRQELHNHVLTQYVEESQTSTMRNTLEHQQKRSHNQEQQFQATKKATVSRAKGYPTEPAKGNSKAYLL